MSRHNDFKGLSNYLGKVADRTPEITENIVKTAAYKVERKAKQKCPVDKGRLKGSITTKTQGIEAEVGTNVEYATFIEYGTVKMAAQPFMTPARQDVENELNSIIAKEVMSYLRS